MITPTLLVLAAGMGSRYGGLKQLDPVGPDGETIMDYSIFDALRAGFGKVVFVIRKEIEEAFKEKIGSRFEKRVPVEYVFQETRQAHPRFFVPEGRTKPWGTTHAILMAANAIHEPFAVINADDFYGASSYQLLAQHLQSGSAGLRNGRICSAQHALGVWHGGAWRMPCDGRWLPQRHYRTEVDRTRRVAHHQHRRRRAGDCIDRRLKWSA